MATAQNILINGQPYPVATLRSILEERLQDPTVENDADLVSLYLNATGDPNTYFTDQVCDGDHLSRMAFTHLYVDDPDPIAFAESVTQAFYPILDRLRETLRTGGTIFWSAY